MTGLPKLRCSVLTADERRLRAEIGQRATGLGLDPVLVGGVQLGVEARQTGRQRADGFRRAVAHQKTHGKVLERDRGLAVERLAGRFQGFGDAHGIDDDVMGLGLR